MRPGLLAAGAKTKSSTPSLPSENKRVKAQHRAETGPLGGQSQLSQQDDVFVVLLDRTREKRRRAEIRSSLGDLILAHSQNTTTRVLFRQ